MNKLPEGFLHGADYNPDQWRAYPEILAEDYRLMPLAHTNVMSIGIFSWSALEPEEGRFEFGWLDEVFDHLHAAGQSVILATPGGARPAWMAQRYPEVLRVGKNRVRNLFGLRHNHCLTSPVFREKCEIINTRLAERYGKHPALILWHVNNEYGGECYCPLCVEAFRQWLRGRYGTLEELNRAWWADFWSMRFSDWEQIEPPCDHGQSTFTALAMDWRLFINHQTIDCYLAEAAPLRRITPEIPVTTNYHRELYDLWEFSRHLDVVAFDNYPFWHHDPRQGFYSLVAPNPPEDEDPELPSTSEYSTAMEAAFDFDMMRSLKGGMRFLMMESTPGAANWHMASPQKERSLAMLSAMQAVAHGSRSVQYFQWRKSRSNFEKHHGAVVDHAGHENTRSFREVAEIGTLLESLDGLAEARVETSVAILHDWEAMYALSGDNGILNEVFHQKPAAYKRAFMPYYRALIENRVMVDFVPPDGTWWDGKKLVVAPMWYLVREEHARHVEAFVEAGGTFVATYWSGAVGKNGLCHLGGLPGPLKRLMGIWVEEANSLAAHRSVRARFHDGSEPEAEIRQFAESIHLEGAIALATFTSGLYEGQPAVTAHSFGRGKAIYLGARFPLHHLRSFFSRLLDDQDTPRILPCELPHGVYATRRKGPSGDVIYLMNFGGEPSTVHLKEGDFTSLPTGEVLKASLELPRFGLRILSQAARELFDA
jgi:beta-galactosidase